MRASVRRQEATFDKAERLAASAAHGTIRLLSLVQELGAITHPMLPRGIAPPPVEGARYLRNIAESARKPVRQALIEASAGGRAAAALAAIDMIGTKSRRAL